MTPREQRLVLLKAGFDPIPCNGKHPVIENWAARDRTNPEEIAIWSSPGGFPYAQNTGIRSKFTPVIDIDILVEEVSRAVEDLAREHFEERGTIMVRTGLAPKRAILLRTDEPFKKLWRSFIPANGIYDPKKPPKIEVLCDGQQCICFGIHPDTHQYYSWHGGEPGQIPRDELPYVRKADVVAFLDAAEKMIVEQYGWQANGGNGDGDNIEPRAHGRSSGNGKDPSAAPKDNFWRNVNELALANLGSWVMTIFPDAEFQRGTGAYRVPSKALGRDLEEDMSISPNGIVDFGVHDMGDARAGKRSAVDVVVEHGGAPDIKAAALWLCEKCKVDPASLGWGSPPEPVVAGRKPDNPVKPVIDIIEGEMPDAVAKAAAALVDSGMTVFRQDDVLVRPLAVEVASSDGRMTQAMRLKPVAAESLLLWLADAADFRKWDKRAKGGWRRCDPPRALAEALLETPETWPFATIAGVITCPTMRHDGSILCRNGYDPATMLYLEIDPDLQMVEVKLNPTRDDALAALARLGELLAEFPFKGEVDRAVALAQVMTFAVRSALPMSPAFLTRAPTAGSGKSYLNDLSNAIISGRDKCPVITAGQTIEETEKRIGAALLEGANVVAIDNCSHDLSGDALCQLTERPRIRIRVLGRSKMPEIENRAVTTFNGNNVGPMGDMTRRTLLCNLDPKVERPELREFGHNPVAMVLAKRGAYLADIFTIIRAFIAADRPEVVGPFASYERWSDMVRAPLVWLGCADPVTSMDQARNEDEGLNTIGEFFTLWQRYLVVGMPFSALEIVGKADERDAGGQYVRSDFRDQLIEIAGRRGEISTRNLGRWLRRVAGRIVGELLIEIKEGADAENHRAPKFILRWVGTETAKLKEVTLSQE